MPDRLAEGSPACVADRQQGNLVVEINEALNDNAPFPRATAGLGILPGLEKIVFTAQNGLPLA